MNTIIRKTTWMCTGMLLALTCGTPAVADDTELLLINPDRAQQVPNVMLIIDSSGSMGDPEETREPRRYPRPILPGGIRVVRI